jgi:hypothetical protein
MITYSTDTSVAARGVYLMTSRRRTRWTASSSTPLDGQALYAAFVPDSAFSRVVQGAFQEAVSRSGGRVVAIRVPLEPNGVTAATRLSGIAGQIDAIFVPDPYDGAALRASPPQASAGAGSRRPAPGSAGGGSGSDRALRRPRPGFRLRRPLPPDSIRIRHRLADLYWSR